MVTSLGDLRIRNSSFVLFQNIVRCFNFLAVESLKRCRELHEAVANEKDPLKLAAAIRELLDLVSHKPSQPDERMQQSFIRID